MLFKIVLTSALALALALSGVAAVAQTSDYPGGPAPQVAGVVLERGETAVGGVTAERRPSSAGAEAGRSDTLPVTGAEIVQLALMGVGLVTAGVVLRWRTRPADDTAR